MAVHTNTETYHVVVECPEGEVPVGAECRETQCPESYTETGGRCLSLAPPPGSVPLYNDTSVQNCSFLMSLDMEEFTELGNDTVLFEGEEIIVMERDENGRPLICVNSSLDSNVSVLLDCPTALLALNDTEYTVLYNNTILSVLLDCPTALLALNDTEYTVLYNNTILYNGEELEVMFYDSLDRPLVCPANSSGVMLEVNRTIIVLLPGIEELTYIGCTLSVVSCICMMLT